MIWDSEDDWWHPYFLSRLLISIMNSLTLQIPSKFWIELKHDLWDRFPTRFEQNWPCERWRWPPFAVLDFPKVSSQGGPDPGTQLPFLEGHGRAIFIMLHVAADVFQAYIGIPRVVAFFVVKWWLSPQSSWVQLGLPKPMMIQLAHFWRWFVSAFLPTLNLNGCLGGDSRKNTEGYCIWIRHLKIAAHAAQPEHICILLQAWCVSVLWSWNCLSLFIQLDKLSGRKTQMYLEYLAVPVFCRFLETYQMVKNDNVDS